MTVAVVSHKGPVLVAIAVFFQIGTNEEQKDDAFNPTRTALQRCIASRCSMLWTTSTSGSLWTRASAAAVTGCKTRRTVS